MNKMTRVMSSCLLIPGVLLTLEASIGQESNTVKVNINFDSRNCPKSVDPSSPAELSRTGKKFIEWQALDPNGQAVDIDFGVYFNPFVGKSVNRHTKTGYLKSIPLDKHAPAAVVNGTMYKYTILADDCPDEPLDPNIRIQR